ncbi:ATP-dependent DNA helicase RecQ [Bacteroidota bacterium]
MSNYKQILTNYWGYTSFRPLQEDIILSVLEGKDTLGLMPTGGGKSITFQVPALTKSGICLVITPLIALMKDQVENLLNKKIKAAAIYSGMSKEEIETILNNCLYGDYKFLYISPERLETRIFKDKVISMNVNLITVDEAHCISQWGYDFRPSYLKINEIRTLKPQIPILALTATATPKVVDDIQDKLNFKEKNVFKKSFERKNLVYLVRETEDKLKHVIKIVTNLKGSGIIYVRNRKKTKEIASYLLKNKITADYYHAGLNNESRENKQNLWKKGINKIMVSTNAFGMGIDKPDVRFVIHYDLPDSPEAYYQEAGRAGRDEQQAFAILLYHKSDKINADKRIKANFPDIKEIKKIYHALGNYYQLPIGYGKHNQFDFDIADFSGKYNFSIISAYNALKILEKEGYIILTEEIDNPSKLHFQVGRDDLYKFQVANIKFDSFIKLLLRSYTGLFSDYMAINEDTLAKRSNTERKVIYDYLNKLKTLGIINYLPRKKNPLVIFTEERLDDKNLYISKSDYESKKNRYVEKLNVMLEYCTEETKCRSEFLLQYFGEKDTYRCGQCDICNQRNELNISKYEFDMILDKIKNRLKLSAASVDEITDLLIEKEDKTIKIIQWLLDNSKIKYNDDKKLYWIT